MDCFRSKADRGRNVCRSVDAIRTRCLWHNDVWRPELGLVGYVRRFVLQHLIDQHHHNGEEEKATEQSSPEIRLPVWNVLAACDDSWHCPEHEEQRRDRLDERQPPLNLLTFGIARRVWTYIRPGNPTSSHWVVMVQLRGGRRCYHLSLIHISEPTRRPP